MRYVKSINYILINKNSYIISIKSFGETLLNKLADNLVY